MSKKCAILSKKFNNGYAVSHSHVRTKKRQHVNLQKKKVWSAKLNQWVKLTISTKALKTLNRNKGL